MSLEHQSQEPSKEIEFKRGPFVSEIAEFDKKREELEAGDPATYEQQLDDYIKERSETSPLVGKVVRIQGSNGILYMKMDDLVTLTVPDTIDLSMFDEPGAVKTKDGSELLREADVTGTVLGFGLNFDTNEEFRMFDIAVSLELDDVEAIKFGAQNISVVLETIDTAEIIDPQVAVS